MQCLAEEQNSNPPKTYELFSLLFWDTNKIIPTPNLCDIRYITEVKILCVCVCVKYRTLEMLSFFVCVIYRTLEMFKSFLCVIYRTLEKLSFFSLVMDYIWIVWIYYGDNNGSLYRDAFLTVQEKLVDVARTWLCGRGPGFCGVPTHNVVPDRRTWQSCWQRIVTK